MKYSQMACQYRVPPEAVYELPIDDSRNDAEFDIQALLAEGRANSDKLPAGVVLPEPTAWAMSKCAKAFRGNGPCISDEQQEALLTQIVHYDDDAAGTLEEIRFQNEPRERDVIHWPLPTDEEFDFATSRGIAT